MRVLGHVLFLWLTALAMWAGEEYARRLSALQSQLATNAMNIPVLLQLGDLCHDEGVRDNPKAVKLAEQYLLKVLELDPTNAMGRVLYGSTLTMKGRDAIWPPTQVGYVKDGNREMDAAVQLAPQDAIVRFNRVNNNFHMPKFLGREGVVKEDLVFLWPLAQTNHPALNTEQKQSIACMQGIVLKKAGKTSEALEVWRAGLEWAPKSNEAEAIQREIKKAGGLK